MSHITNTPNISTVSIDKCLKLDEINCNADHKRRITDLRRKARKSIQSTKNIPRSLEGIDRALWRWLSRMCSDTRDGKDEFEASPRSACSSNERERVIAEIRAFAQASNAGAAK
jgi:hypothetical protein